MLTDGIASESTENAEPREPDTDSSLSKENTSRRCFLQAAGGAGVVGLVGMPGAAAEKQHHQHKNDTLTLVDSGESKGVILHWSSDDDEPVAGFAASELQDYIAEMSGVTVPIREVSVTAPAQMENAASGLVVLTGGEANRYLHSKGHGKGKGHSKLPIGWVKSVDDALADTKPDSFAVRTDGQRMTLAGTTHRGTLYSAYELLERQGVRFFAPDFVFYEGNGEHVPSKSTVSSDSLDITEKPSLEYRSKFIGEGISFTHQNLPKLVDWMAKNRHNVLSYPTNSQGLGVRWDRHRDHLIPELEKRGIMVETGFHGFQLFLPRDEYEDEHPDWFVDGFRGFNLANEEAIQTYIDNVIQYLEKRPEVDVFAAWPPDGKPIFPPSVADKFGSIPNGNAHLLNQLNTEIQEAFPGRDIEVEDISYGAITRAPDSEYAPDDDMLFDITMGRGYNAPVFNEANRQRELYLDIYNGWEDVFDGVLGTFTYYVKYAWHSVPVVLPEVISQDVSDYHSKFGTERIMMYCEPANWITFELNHLLLAASAWDANLDANEYVKEYLQDRYSQVADKMRTYLDLLEDANNALFVKATGAYGDLDRVSTARKKYIQAQEVLATARTETEDEATADLVQSLEWNAEYAVADSEISYYDLLGKPQKAFQAKQKVYKLTKEHRFDGIILQETYATRRFGGQISRREDIETYRIKWGSLEGKFPELSSPEPPEVITGSNRINNWVDAAPVIDETTVDIGLKNQQPRYPSGYFYNDVYYVVCTVNGTTGSGEDREVVLLSSTSPKEGFAQISQVTSNPGVFMQTPGIIVDETDEMWVLFEDQSDGSDIRAKHQPVGEIGADPSDWTDEGVVINDGAAPGLTRDQDGKYYCFYTGAGKVVSRQESTDLMHWSNIVANVYDEANNQGPDVIPKADKSGEYWLTVTAYDGSLYAVAGEGTDLLDEEYEGRTLVANTGDLNGIQESWFSDDTSWFGYVKQNTGKDVVHHNDGIVAYFEGRNGGKYSIGYAISDDSPDR